MADGMTESDKKTLNFISTYGGQSAAAQALQAGEAAKKHHFVEAMELATKADLKVAGGLLARAGSAIEHALDNIPPLDTPISANDSSPTSKNRRS